MLRFKILLGLVCGSLFAMLFAPQRGRILRETMQKVHIKGGNSIEPLKRGFVAMGKDISNTFKQELYEKAEKNPFTITNIYRYVGKKS